MSDSQQLSLFDAPAPPSEPKPAPEPQADSANPAPESEAGPTAAPGAGPVAVGELFRPPEAPRDESTPTSRHSEFSQTSSPAVPPRPPNSAVRWAAGRAGALSRACSIPATEHWATATTPCVLGWPTRPPTTQRRAACSMPTTPRPLWPRRCGTGLPRRGYAAAGRWRSAAARACSWCPHRLADGAHRPQHGVAHPRPLRRRCRASHTHSRTVAVTETACLAGRDSSRSCEVVPGSGPHASVPAHIPDQS